MDFINQETSSETERYIEHQFSSLLNVRRAVVTRDYDGPWLQSTGLEVEAVIHCQLRLIVFAVEA